VHCDGSTSWAALTSCEHFFPAWQGAWQTSVKLADLRMPVSIDRRGGQHRDLRVSLTTDQGLDTLEHAVRTGSVTVFSFGWT
jgi:hypothetical protein